MWTYEALLGQAEAMATKLSDAGARPGFIVASSPRRDPQAVTLIHAAAITGATLAPGHLRWTRAEWRRFDEWIRPDLRVRGTGRRDAGERAAPPGSVSEIDFEPVRPGDGAGAASALEAAVLMWTSGSQGDPRVVPLTPAALRASAKAVNLRIGFGSGDAWLLSLGPAHIGGLAIVVRGAVAGAEVVCLPDGAWSAPAALDALARGLVSHMSVVPTMLDELLSTGADPRSFSRLKAVLVGGAPIRADLLERAVSAGWPVALTYGMTETGSQVATALPALVREKPGCAGPPLDGVEFRVSPGGEIQVRGQMVAAFDWREATPLLDADGWLATGDLGRLDDDGHLWIEGRRSRTIISGGVNVDPAYVERSLREHPAVADALVVGLPDPAWGECVGALIVKSERADASDLTAIELETWTRSRLSSAHRPRVWRVVANMPLTPTGKPDAHAAGRLLGAEEDA